MAKRKNEMIELYKIVALFVVLITHSGFVADESSPVFFLTPFLVVDFYFISSGCFTMKHVMEKAADKTHKFRYSVYYSIVKCSKIFPYAAFGTVLSYIFKWCTMPAGCSLKERFWGIWNLPIELMFLPMLGVMSVETGDYQNAPMWYISVLLITVPFVVYLAMRLKKLFSYLIAILIPISLNLFLMHRQGIFYGWGETVGFTYAGVIRGFAQLCLGCFAYVVADSLAKWYDKKGFVKNKVADTTIETTKASNAAIMVIYKCVVTIIELFGYVYLLYLCTGMNPVIRNLKGVFLLALSMAISLSGTSYTVKIKGKLLSWISGLSVPIYCIHWPMYQIVQRVFGQLGYWYKVGINFAICLILALVLKKCVNLRKRR